MKKPVSDLGGGSKVGDKDKAEERQNQGGISERLEASEIGRMPKIRFKEGAGAYAGITPVPGFDF